MPKSRTRRRSQGKQSLPRRRPAGRRQPTPRVDLVAQRRMALLVDDLEVLLHAVPLAYNDHDLSEVVEHHYRVTAVVNYILDNEVIDLLAGLAGGDMIVMPEDQPAARPGPADPDDPDAPLPGWVLDEIEAGELGPGPLPARRPGEAILALPDVPAVDRAELEASARVQRPVAPGRVGTDHTCARCSRGGLATRTDGSHYRHKAPDGSWCQ